MLVRTRRFESRLAALEAYVDTPKEPRGMTLTARIEAQHQMLVALQETQSDLGRRMTRVEDRLTGVEGRLERVEDRLDRVEGRLDRVEDRLNTIEGTLGVVLHGVTAIKNMLKPPDDPDEGPSLNGTRLPVG